MEVFHIFFFFSFSVLFKDKEVAEKVLKETDPLKHKKLGRQVKYFNQKTWDAHCSAIVERGNKAKVISRLLLNDKSLVTYSLQLVNVCNKIFH